jgi:hypothetical protein
MTCGMCSPWKMTFTLEPLVPLTVISPLISISLMMFWVLELNQKVIQSTL